MDIPTRLPTLFLSHGSPMLAIEDSAAGRFLDGLGAQLPWPKAIVVASAHFMTDRPMLGGHPQPHTVHDFGGFPAPLYQIQYPAPGDPGLAEAIRARLEEAGLHPKVRESHGLDHGIWVPLRRMYPQAGIPVVPLSVMPHGDAAQHYALGRALAPLREEGVLVIGSGGFVHNLGDLDWQHRDAPLAPWAREFGEWMHARLDAHDHAALLDWQAQAPHARHAHPTVEHLMPLFVAMGAAGAQASVRTIHRSHEMGSLALDAFAFD
ncbi:MULTISPECIES: class III extradiol ring-cleavage dioxygenase [unclassified Lysobacter]|uniref:DODA-type extradiol aromatic ring-opening family dioxygenase n=1 Tax=unclassified Lysobacter TaxID=2635362 RepID=UPI0007102AE4|nr:MULTISPECIES: class III extradiol ring-cleavage dioxygenase [unclassified Lysobacter]KRD38867.1 extradiol ring-cleavage dioxygenase [Lysobacter sp. Root916]KRD78429.1 extradiol ring-cleavage dioxygenase [Lysobacter sp. Root983]